MIVFYLYLVARRAAQQGSGVGASPGVPNQGSMDPLGSMTISQGVHGRI